MLSRIAEALYWVGRYMERAEDTARILDVHVHQTLEDASLDSTDACRDVLQVMGVEAPEAILDAPSVSRLLAFDRGQRSSITSVLTAARENARGVREVISAELWEALNATYNALDAQLAAARSLGPHAFFRWVKERAAVAAGLADSTMSRDDGWRFLVLGRSVERVDMTARLLSVRFADPGSSPEWVTTLRCCSAHEAYLRTYHRAVDASLVVDFLLLDQRFPRSAWYALADAESALVELEAQPSERGPDDEARRVLGRARTDLEYRRRGQGWDDLPAVLAGLQQACAEANLAVAERYFHQGRALSWTSEPVGVGGA